jgi:hypothetical protein
MAKRIAYHVIKYGEWTRPRLRNFREQCCGVAEQLVLPQLAVVNRQSTLPRRY